MRDERPCYLKQLLITLESFSFQIKLENFPQSLKSKSPTKSIANGCEGSEDHMTNGQTNQNISNGHVTNGIDHVTNGCHDPTSESGDHVKYPVNLDLEHVLGKMPQKVPNKY